MDTQHPPTITSFVIRFVVEAAADTSQGPFSLYRGSIHHIQSDESLNFSEWQDAVEFIQRYVSLEVTGQE